jgi:hypothetical protein
VFPIKSGARDIFLVQRYHVMPKHKFKIGQRLFIVRALNAPDGPYVVVKRSPKRHGQFEYQVKCVTESHERVARSIGVHGEPAEFLNRLLTRIPDFWLHSLLYPNWKYFLD